MNARRVGGGFVWGGGSLCEERRRREGGGLRSVQVKGKSKEGRNSHYCCTVVFQIHILIVYHDKYTSVNKHGRGSVCSLMLMDEGGLEA